MKQFVMKSKIGKLFLVSSEEGLHGVYWTKRNIPITNTPDGIIREAVKQLEEYFNHKRVKFDLPLSARGTAFQKKVWDELKKIPYGETCSYGDIAKRIKNVKAVRAVGAANGRNPLSIVVPCHRVIGANGTLTGFAGGLDIKAKLLKLEQRQ